MDNLARVRAAQRAAEAEAHIRELLAHLGEDPDREELRKTPARVREALEFLTAGYRSDPQEMLNGAVFDTDSDEMVLVRDIDMFSLCEHHLLPFFGKAHVAYIPAGRIVGISKLARLVDVYARRLQVQERLTHQVATALEEFLQPRGVAVVVEAQHLCMMMRGVEKQNSLTVTSCMLGAFRDQASTRQEFLSYIKPRDSHL